VCSCYGARMLIRRLIDRLVPTGQAGNLATPPRDWRPIGLWACRLRVVGFWGFWSRVIERGWPWTDRGGGGEEDAELEINVSYAASGMVLPSPGACRLFVVGSRRFWSRVYGGGLDWRGGLRLGLVGVAYGQWIRSANSLAPRSIRPPERSVADARGCSAGMPELVVGFLEQRNDGRHAPGLL